DLRVPKFLLSARLVGGDGVRLVADRPERVRGAREGRRPLQVADELHFSQIGAVDDGDAAAPERAIHAVAADHRRTVQGDRLLVRHRIAFLARAVRFLPWQAPDADKLRIEGIADVHGPDDTPVPALRVVGEEGELALVVDAEP